MRIMKITGLRHSCRKKGEVCLVLKSCRKGQESQYAKVSSDEMQKLTSFYQVDEEEQLIRRKLCMLDESLYALIQVKGNVQGDVRMPFAGQILGFDSEETKCIWQVGIEGKEHPSIRVITSHLNLVEIQNALRCVFPWDLKGKSVIYTGRYVYILYRIK